MITLTPAIGEAGKTTVYVRRLNAAIDTDRLDRDSLYIAITHRCAHLGCPVRWVDAAERFICPCHGGVYDLLGRRVGGPPVRPLDRFYTRVVGTARSQIGPRFSVNSELERFSPRDPGEPIDGIGQYLYPSRPGAAETVGAWRAMPKLPAPPDARGPAGAAAAAGRRQRQARRPPTTPRRPAHASSTGSTSAPR